ncbi:ATP-dependent DNA helicase RecG [Helicobacter aurati]|uniref:ATP-dependent DNA helicase RecG n=1 Tax=Helicobacter aurati TaxID=137778 RepID=A0A3D8J8I6_9HELI|nr:ATP-dependent DNA helicase RecG [Helicobacter aurati]RDU73171.1 ATP-dependent DNA helicase RecG [Helicobacter aurati]
MGSLLAYCLEHIPKGYFSTYLIDSLTQGQEGALKIRVFNIKKYKTTLFIEAQALTFQKPIRIVIFNYRPYHHKIFSAGNELFVQGFIEQEKNAYGDNLTLINPKIITEINTIKAIFKRRGIHLDILQKRICWESLLATQIGEKYAKYLYEIFHPSLEFFKAYNAIKAFPSEYIQAIKFTEIFSYIQKLQNKRTNFPAKFQCQGDLQPFLNKLPFRLTKAQQAAINDIANDLSSMKATKRIIMGDVGCGKTMVILASVMLTYPQKSILMVPTSILAQQIYNEAKKYLPAFIKTICITSRSNGKNDIVGDFVIGTQAILYRGGDFTNFALVMTDEQHRFGAAVRMKLEKMFESKDGINIKKPHNLQFSATPIPRTMAMLQSNMIDFSFIKELPCKKDITTRIIDKTGFSSLITQIKQELANNNQVAIIYPRIEDTAIETNTQDSTRKNNIPYMSLKDAQSYWEKHFTSVFSTHGKDKEKEEILQRFGQTKGAILLATTMVEVGISLPHLTIIVIVGAERLGLASLHQLRGRVSRNGTKGYCYLYTHQVCNERLIKFSQTLSGFDIAELDLEYRSGGDLLDGIAQSGDTFTYFNMLIDKELLQEAQQKLANQLLILND